MTFTDLQARLLDLQGTIRLFVSAGCAVGRDSVDSHRAFYTSLEVALPILSDPDREVATSFNVPMHWPLPAKSSFLIGPDDTVHYVYDWLRPAGTWLHP